MPARQGNWWQTNELPFTAPHCFLTTSRVAAPWLRRLVAGISPRKSAFDPRPVHVEFAVDIVALGQGLPRVLRLSPVTITPPMHQIHWSNTERCTSLATHQRRQINTSVARRSVCISALWSEFWNMCFYFKHRNSVLFVCVINFLC
jgi:hypothetical protein